MVFLRDTREEHSSGPDAGVKRADVGALARNAPGAWTPKRRAALRRASGSIEL